MSWWPTALDRKLSGRYSQKHYFTQEAGKEEDRCECGELRGCHNSHYDPEPPGPGQYDVSCFIDWCCAVAEMARQENSGVRVSWRDIAAAVRAVGPPPQEDEEETGLAGFGLPR